MKQKIYIVGCAKTGTTLLQRCFFAFKDIFPVMGEISVDQLIDIKSPKSTLLAKRTRDTVFSNVLPGDEIKRQLNLLRKNGIGLVMTYRNEADVLRSRYVSKERYGACVEQFRDHHADLDLVVSYERLTASPDSVQEWIADRFELCPRHKFSQYPDFVPKQVFSFITDGRYRPRRIGEVA